MTRTKVQCENKDCKKFFNTQEKLEAHMLAAHGTVKTFKGKVTETPTQDFEVVQEHKCPSCDFTTKVPRGLASHITKMHSKSVSKPLKRGDDVTDSDKDGLIKKLTFQNIELGDSVEELTFALEQSNKKIKGLEAELERVNVQLYEAYQELDKVKEGPRDGIVVTKMDIQRARRLQLRLEGDPEGKTDEERLGLLKCYDIIKTLNEQQRNEIEEIRKGLIPQAWLEGIRSDFKASVDMIIEGMASNVADRSKVDKFNKMMEMLREANNE